MNNPLKYTDPSGYAASEGQPSLKERHKTQNSCTEDPMCGDLFRRMEGKKKVIGSVITITSNAGNGATSTVTYIKIDGANIGSTTSNADAGTTLTIKKGVKLLASRYSQKFHFYCI